MTARVVVGADGSSPADNAVEWAAEDAVRRGCALRDRSCVRAVDR